MLLASRRAENIPRNPLGIPLVDALNPAYNPMNQNPDGQFIAEPFVDFAEYSKEKAIEARKAIVGKDDDWPLLWRVTLELPDEEAAN